MSTESRPPLHERVAAAMDSAGDVTGAALLRHIEQRHADDAELVAEVRVLLGATSSHVPVLDSPLDLSITPTLVRSAAGVLAGADGTARAVPAEIAGYRILRVVGEGGMGVVYEGEQREPRRRVAIKVLRPALSLSALQRRFRQEAQVLARLTHPGIAHVIESGVDQKTGGAFFAMEFVDGATLREHAASLDLSDRCELISRVCEAVQHAHQKGVIHRDLKPSNILVEPEPSGPGRPRVLDFGVAKLLEGDEQATLSMGEGTLVGTLGYMSPEALTGGVDAIDTRTDVYSLGVVLYELLAERPPIDIKGVPLTEVARRVREQEPPKLHTVNPRVARDLSTVVHKALEKDPERRYDTAGALGEDIRRFLRDEPVAAQPPSAVYTARKFVARHTAASVAAGAAVLVLVAGLTVSLVLFTRAERARREEQSQRERASAILDYLVKDMLGAASPERVGKDARIIDQLDELGKNVGTRFPGRPDLEAEVRMQLAMVMNMLGMRTQALEQARAAQPLLETLYSPDDRRVIDSLAQQTTTLLDSAEAARAAPLAEEAFVRAVRSLAPDDPTRLSIEGLRANCMHGQGRAEEALPLLRGVLERADRVGTMDSNVLFALRGNYLAALVQSGKLEEAAPQFAACLRESTALKGADHPATISLRNNYANCLMKLSRREEAAEVVGPLVGLVRSRYPDDHQFLAIALHSTASVYVQCGRAHDAVPLALEAVDALTRVNTADHWQTERAVATAVNAYASVGNVEEARAWALRLIVTRLRIASPGEGESVRNVWGDTAKKLGRVDPTATPEALLADVLAAKDMACPPTHARRAAFLANLARACAGMSRPGDARSLISEARALPGADQNDVKEILSAAESQLQGP